MVAPARRVAARILHRIDKDEAWASPTLDAELTRAGLSAKDAGLATQIVYGTLRVQPLLDVAIQERAKHPVRVDGWTEAVLRSAVFQLMHLARVPPHAVVHDAVELVRDKRGKRMAGFTNAILRGIARDRPADPRLPQAVAISSWLEESLHRSIGETRTSTLLGLGQEDPSVDLRVRLGLERDSVAESIRGERPGATLAGTKLSPQGIRVSGAGDLRGTEAYRGGDFAVQEEGSQLIGLLTNAQPGERVLDLCAGRGGKTTQLVDAVGATGSVVATDLHEHRLEQIAAELARLQLPVNRLDSAAVDWTVGPGPIRGLFDRVLVDAPCTGLGTLRRRPEILHRISPEDITRMAEIQRSILAHAAATVRPGGTLVYAVCSPLREEGIEVVQSVDLPGFEPAPSSSFSLISRLFEATHPLVLGPSQEGGGPWADAYQAFVWVHVGHHVDSGPPQR